MSSRTRFQARWEATQDTRSEKPPTPPWAIQLARPPSKEFESGAGNSGFEVPDDTGYREGGLDEVTGIVVRESVELRDLVAEGGDAEPARESATGWQHHFRSVV
jgi:hypothetical protein